MNEKQKLFIETIGALARNEYLNRAKWVLPSVCIAQAILESGWNLNASTLFGIKGKGFTTSTNEYINGEWVKIQDSFKKYPNISASVIGYYDFITTTPRYKNVVCNEDYKKAVYYLIHTTDGCPYATAPNYINTIIQLIEDYNLTEFDVKTVKKKNNTTVAIECIIGLWGNGEERTYKLKTNGYNPSIIQKKINYIYNVKNKFEKMGYKINVEKEN